MPTATIRLNAKKRLPPYLSALRAFKDPALAIRTLVGPKLTAWMGRIEALPYFARTLPPHWKNN